MVPGTKDPAQLGDSVTSEMTKDKAASHLNIKSFRTDRMQIINAWREHGWRFVSERT